MQTLALVNPRRKHRHKTRRPMTEKQAKYFGGSKGRRRRKASRASPAAAATPRRRRKGALRRHARRFARSVSGSGISMRGINVNQFMKGTLIPSAVGAAGALGVDLLMGYAAPYLPASMTTGPVVPLTKIAAAIGIGLLAQVATKDRRVSEQVTAGAITVIAYDYIRSMAKAQFPTLPLSEYVSGMGYAGPALAYPDRGMGVYVGQTQAWNPSIAARVGGGTGKTVLPVKAGMGEFMEGDYAYN